MADVIALKKKIIKDFMSLICDLRKGYSPKQDHIIEEISYVDLIENNKLDKKLSLIILQYYLNK